MQNHKVPNWLDTIGRKFWRTHVHALDNLNESNIETFAVLCEVYSMMRREKEPRSKKLLIDAYIRLSTQFGLTPRSSKFTTSEKTKTVNFFGEDS